jgi:hypothetical protein
MVGTNGCFNGKIHAENGGCSTTMLDYWRVFSLLIQRGVFHHRELMILTAENGMAMDPATFWVVQRFLGHI